MEEFPPSLVFIAKKEVVRIQVDRFHEFYSEYFELPETKPMVDFFFDRIYNLDGKEEWLKLAEDTFEKVKHIIKEQTRKNIEQLIELNNLTDILDTAMAYHILRKGWKEGDLLNQDIYYQYYKEMGHVFDRKRQLDIVIHNLKLFYDLAHRPINSVLMRPARFMSKILGVYPLFASVEEGYHAILPVKREVFDSFLEKVSKREWEYLHTAFPKDPEGLSEEDL